MDSRNNTNRNNSLPNIKDRWDYLIKENFEKVLENRKFAPNQTLISESSNKFNFKAATFNQAIQELNRLIILAANNINNNVPSLSDFKLIMIKYKQKDLHIHEEDFKFLYDFILKIHAVSDNNNDFDKEKQQNALNAIQRLYIEYYLEHHKYFNKKDCIEKAKTLCENSKNKHSIAALARTYFKLGATPEARKLIEDNLSSFKSKQINRYYIPILYDTKGFECALAYYEQLFNEYANKKNSNKMLDTHCYREMLQLYQKELLKTEKKDNKNELLDKAVEQYNKIPTDMKIDQVARVILKLLFEYKSVEAGYQFFLEMKKLPIQITDHTYKEVMKNLQGKKEFSLAMDVLTDAWKNNVFTNNRPKTTTLTMDLHLESQTGSGIPIGHGLDDGIINIAIACLFKDIVENYASRTDKLNIELITGKGTNSYVKNYTMDILKHLQIKNVYSPEHNLGMICFQLETKELNDKIFLSRLLTPVVFEREKITPSSSLNNNESDNKYVIPAKRQQSVFPSSDNNNEKNTKSDVTNNKEKTLSGNFFKTKTHQIRVKNPGQPIQVQISENKNIEKKM